ncbi:MAG: DUF1840 domain-containing protein [Betaproteobacteria bacterium]
MLVRFRSDAGDLLMFGDVAVTLLKMMGQTGDLPGAILASDIPAALDRLQGAVGAQRDAPSPEAAGRHDERDPPVSLRQRAFPLIELLQRAIRKNVDVIWQVERA